MTIYAILFEDNVNCTAGQVRNRNDDLKLPEDGGGEVNCSRNFRNFIAGFFHRARNSGNPAFPPCVRA